MLLDFLLERRRWDSNPRMRILQTLALPLGYVAVLTQFGEYIISPRLRQKMTAKRGSFTHRTLCRTAAIYVWMHL